MDISKEEIINAAIEQQIRYGVPASITLAQAQLESGMGTSSIAQRSNNLFGMKAYNWTGPYIGTGTGNYRAYSSAYNSILDHSIFLCGKRYQPLHSLSPTDYVGWSRGLQNLGYAEDRNYASKLQNVIQTNGFAKFDQMAMQLATQRGQTIGYQNSNLVHLDNLQGNWSMPMDLKDTQITGEYHEKRPNHLHEGIDISTKGTYRDVVATEDKGVVVSTGSSPTAGNFVTVQYNRADGINFQCTYMHLGSINVEKNQTVQAGTKLGVSGSTGRSTGPHLHITCRLNGRLTDPLQLLLYIKGVKAKAIAALHLDEDKILSPSQFIKKYSEAAMRQQRKYGIPASVILAQMAYESSWGNSNLAQAGYNYFGIKCSQNWLAQGLPYSLHNDDRPNEKFCSFSNPEASIEYHSRLLMSKNYWRCWKYSPTDFHNWLVAIKASGYATAKDYVRKCESIILKHKLYLYDQVADRM